MAAHRLAQVEGSLNRLVCACSHYRPCHLAGVRQLAIQPQNPLQLLLVGAVHNIPCRQLLPLVHAQIQRTLVAGRETPLRHVELVRRHTQVRQQSVHLPHPVQPQETLRMTEILVQQRKPWVIQRISQCVGILVKGNQPPPVAQERQDSTRVAATPEGSVHIRPVRTDVQSLDAFIEHHWQMIVHAVFPVFR